MCSANYPPLLRGLQIGSLKVSLSRNRRDRYNLIGHDITTAAINRAAGINLFSNEPQYKALFVRLVSRHGVKMKAAVAVQRKLLELSFTLVKNNEFYKAPEEAEVKSDWQNANSLVLTNN